MLEVHVDVGRLVAFFRNEALEQQLGLAGLQLGDPQRVADRGVGGGAAALAEDVPAACVTHDVMHGEEVGLVALLRDDRELLADQLDGFRLFLPAGSGFFPALANAHPHQAA